MTIDGWDVANVETGEMGIWENLKTDYNLVSDGQLTIGMIGSQDIAKRESSTWNGWFCVTNFRLYYLGAPGLETLQQVYNEKIAAANALVENVYFAADKKALQDVIAANNSASGEEAINAAMQKIAAAVEIAQASVVKHTGIMTGIYTTIISNMESYGACADLMNGALALADNQIGRASCRERVLRLV